MAKKKIILCDTNIIIEFLKENTVVVKNISQIGSNSIYISTITAAELFFGALNKNELSYSLKLSQPSFLHQPL